MKNIKKTPVSIAHLSSVHRRDDIRIFHKMCKSLSSAGYQVSYIVSDGFGNKISHNISIIDTGKKTSNRLLRMILSTWRVYRAALKSGAVICHLHDPELVPYSMLLRMHGKKVIYDAHEDMPRQLLSKPYLKKTTARVLSAVLEIVENLSVKWVNKVITATDTIGKRFELIKPGVTVINNYPSVRELHIPAELNNKIARACYVGGLSFIRGAEEIGLASEICICKIEIAGSFDKESLMQKVLGNHDNIKFLGMLTRDKVGKFISESICGLVTFHPVPNHLNALPTKLFEYMAAGIPVIASDFPLWKKIVEEGECGICVNPLDPEQIAKAINYFMDNPEEVERMGRNGSKLVEQKYNWLIEEKKLLKLYNNLTRDKNKEV